MITNFSMEDHRPRWGGWTSNPDGAASGPWQVRLLWSPPIELNLILLISYYISIFNSTNINGSVESRVIK